MSDRKPAAGIDDDRAKEVRVKDLERKGIQRVKVLRERELTELIERAVTEALQGSERQRAALLARSRRARRREGEERKALAEDAVQFQQRIDALCTSNGKLEVTARTLRERDAALAREEEELSAQVRTATVLLVRERERTAALDGERERARAARHRTTELEAQWAALVRAGAPELTHEHRDPEVPS